MKLPVPTEALAATSLTLFLAACIDSTQGLRPGEKPGDSKPVDLQPVDPRANLRAPLKRLAGSAGHVCTARAGGQVFCWGRSDFGEAGPIGMNPSPVKIPGIDEAIAVATGDLFSCAVTGQKKVKCWGGDSEQNGFTHVFGLEAMEVPGAERVKQLVIGGLHACVLTEDGRVACFGSNLAGELGDNTLESRLEARVIPGLEQIEEIAAGQVHTLARRADGKVFAFGYAEFGQIGDDRPGEQSCPPDAETRCTPSPVEVVDIDDALSITAGLFSSCALREGGEVYCWGWDYAGQLGDGRPAMEMVNADFQPRPVKMQIENAEAIYAGYIKICSLDISGALRCFGFLSGEDFAPEGDWQGFPAALEVSGGWYFLCTLDAQGQVWCLGDDSFGTLGDGPDVLETKVPVKILGSLEASIDRATGEVSLTLLTPPRAPVVLPPRKRDNRVVRGRP